MKFSAWEVTLARATKTKSSPVRSIMREILSLQAQKIILVAFGKICALFANGMMNKRNSKLKLQWERSNRNRIEKSDQRFID